MSDQYPPSNPYQGPYPTPGGGPYAAPPEHQHATLILVLGVLGLALCQLIGPVAWVMGHRARKEIAASRGTLGGHTQVTVGWVLGIVSTLLLVLSLVIVGAFIVIAIIGAGATAPGTSI